MPSIILSFLGSLLQSRAGQLIVVAVAAWFWSEYTTSTHWRGVIAAREAAVAAAYKEEIARQQQAAEEIAKAATERAETDAAVVADMQNIITNYEKKLKERPHVSAQKSDCLIDNDFAGVVRKLSDASGRKAGASRNPHRVR